MDETILDEPTPDASDDDSAAGDRPQDSEELQATELLWQTQLERTTNETGRRVERWIVEQRRRMADGLDLLLIDLERRRQDELARFDEWKASARGRLEEEIAVEREHARQQLTQELATERERFHEQMLGELKAFEEQLALRLQEHEARLALWWDEAEDMAARRFAALGLERGSTTVNT